MEALPWDEGVRLSMDAANASWSALVDCLTRKLPELMQLGASALSKAGRRLPKTLDYAHVAAWANELSTSGDALELVAPCSCMLVVVAWVFVAVRGGLGAGESDVKAPARSVGHEHVNKDTHWLTRILLLRGVGTIYFFGFLCSAVQGRAIFGTKGVQAIASYTETGRPTPAFYALDTWLGIPHHDVLLELVCWMGVYVSLFMVFAEHVPAVVPAAAWALYLSLVNLGRPLLGYGWEWLTLEIGFLAIFLCPVLPRAFADPRHRPSLPVIWLFRWCAFRVLIGAGMSKIGRNSSDCWKELSCTDTHYFTQPMPNPLAWFAHRVSRPRLCTARTRHQVAGIVWHSR